MLRAIAQLIAAWYRSDAVRVSPMEGKLLQLRDDDEFVLLNELYRVVETAVPSDDGPPEIVRYVLCTPEDTGSLEVAVSTPNSGQLRFGGEEVTVFPEDLQIVSRR